MWAESLAAVILQVFKQSRHHTRISPHAHYQKKRLRAAVEHERRLLANGAVDRLLGVLPVARVESLIAEHCGAYRSRVFPPLATLGLFVEQAIRLDSACQEAVSHFRSQRLALGLAPCGLGTGSYCKARQRLPLSLFEACARDVAGIAEAALPAHARWRGRAVKLIDGTHLSMPDTPMLQASFPQNQQQAPGLGFPLVRVVSVVSLASGCVVDWTLGPCEGKGNGESTQLWRLLDRFSTADVLIADRAYGSYFLLAELMQRGIDFVIRQHGARKNSGARRVPLGPNDSLLNGSRPTQPEWMDDATYARMPITLPLREVRDGKRVIVTSLSNPADVEPTEIAWLYEQRWSIELDFRSIKCCLQMDVLRCKSSAMVKKEIAAHLLGYNLIRRAMGDAAAANGLALRRLSFAAARRAAALYQDNARRGMTSEQRIQACFLLAQQIAYWKIPDRPGRIEPRAVKRRPKPRPLLTEPRTIARARIRGELEALVA